MKKTLLLKKVSDITFKKGILATLIGANVAMLSACGSDSSSEDDSYNTDDLEEVETFEKGVITQLVEKPEGVFTIANEKVTSLDSTKVLITQADGTEKELPLSEAESAITLLMAKPETVGKDNSLGNALLFSGIGYILAKTSHPEYGTYRPDINTELKPETTAKADSATHNKNRYHSGGGSSWMMHYFLWSRFYRSPGIFNNSQAVHSSVNNSRYSTFRPVGGRSGFFRSTGRTRSSFGG
jgi:hypothetical protein